MVQLRRRRRHPCLTIIPHLDVQCPSGSDGDGAEDVLVLARGEVQMRSLSDGVIAWTAEAATRETQHAAALAAAQQEA